MAAGERRRPCRRQRPLLRAVLRLCSRGPLPRGSRDGREAPGLALLLAALAPGGAGALRAPARSYGHAGAAVSIRRRSWRFVASGISVSWPTASMYARRSDGVKRLSIRCACSGVFGSPNACIFFIAAASSGFWRSSAAIDIFWNHRLNSGTLERKVTIGRRYRPPGSGRAARGCRAGRRRRAARRTGSRPRTARRDGTRCRVREAGTLWLPASHGAIPVRQWIPSADSCSRAASDFGRAQRRALVGLGIGLALADSSVVTLALPDILRQFDVEIPRSRGS